MLSKNRELSAGCSKKVRDQICMDKKPVWVDPSDDVVKSSALPVRSWPKLGLNSIKSPVTELCGTSVVTQNSRPDISADQFVDSDCKCLVMEKNVESKNAISTIQSYENKNRVVSEDAGESKNSNDDYKISLKMKKLQMKENRRIKREEEIRRRIIAPKCQKVKIIDTTLMEMITNGDKKKRLQSDCFQLNNASTEFPDLCAIPVKMRQKNSDCNSVKTGFFHEIKSETDDKSDGKIAKTYNCMYSKASNNKKKVKTSDPILFNIGTAISALQRKQKVVKSESSRNSVKKKRSRLLSGNRLDSDNPLRKRGKFRETGKTKLSRVKRAVLKHRHLKTNLINEYKVKLLNCKKLLLNDILDDNDLFYHSVKNSHYYNQGDADANCAIDPKILIHSRKFRRYCDQWPNKELNESVHKLIKAVVRFQDRNYSHDPIKAYARRRYVCGFHEVLKCININKVKLVVIATDIECVDGEDSLFNYILQVTKSSDALAIPYVYCGSRWSLKSCFKKKSLISCAAILNYDGAEELYANIIRLLPLVRKMYREKLSEAEQKCGIRRQAEEDVTVTCITSVLKSLSISNNINMKSCDDSAGQVDKIASDDEACPFMAALLKSVKIAD